MTCKKKKTMKTSVRFETDLYKPTCKHPVFHPKYRKIFQYLKNWNKSGSLSCAKNEYPVFQNQTYCCATRQSSLQEILDYIHGRLNAIMQNMSGFQLPIHDILIKILFKTRQDIIRYAKTKKIQLIYDDLHADDIIKWHKSTMNGATSYEKRQREEKRNFYKRYDELKINGKLRDIVEKYNFPDDLSSKEWKWILECNPEANDANTTDKCVSTVKELLLNTRQNGRRTILH